MIFIHFPHLEIFVFHPQEYRYTINQLHEILISNKLNFLGFLLTQPFKYLYHEYFPEDKKQINLQKLVKV